ncbi:MAG: type II secretion system protein [Cyanobacteria bacterium SIG26]|nr:type II secretion system protein [Cyanobacteria bacterium SIG26]
MKNKKAFTLTELLMAMVIVGTVAALTIPVIVKEINKEMYTTKLRGLISSVEYAIIDQMSEGKTKDLSLTAFGDAGTLFSSAKFDTAKVCNETNVAQCWNTTSKYRGLSDSATADWVPGVAFAKLKNGIMLGAENVSEDDLKVIYEGTPREDAAIIKICADLNGVEAPNIAGRDAFCFYITRKGHIVSRQDFNNINTKAVAQTLCKGQSVLLATYNCFDYLMQNNWNMDY